MPEGDVKLRCIEGKKKREKRRIKTSHGWYAWYALTELLPDVRSGVADGDHGVKQKRTHIEK